MSDRSASIGAVLARLTTTDPDAANLIRREITDLRAEAATWRRRFRGATRDLQTATSRQDNHRETP
ncbi:hypothetical protein ABLG96_03825 [Nakamurella sp. A5-74]|uniref:Uncharacterized protein n=1 Tax=Nakamurella sp. A5-74 TaxID=3158264 RepID=A0AAU8DRN5_9ACTN